MSTPNYQTILYDVDEGVATVRLNRPERRNALTRRCSVNCTRLSWPPPTIRPCARLS